MKQLELMYITGDPATAEIAVSGGIDRIFVDLETLGKQERQAGQKTPINHHHAPNIRIIKNRIGKFPVMARVNPWNENSKQEIDSVIQFGAEIVMLPYFKTPEEVDRFVKAVSGRAKTNLLFETTEALQQLDSILKIVGIDEAHLGLNDLKISLGLKFLFEIYLGDIPEKFARNCKKMGISFGIGGIGAINGTNDLVPARYVLGEILRLGSDRVILSRSFSFRPEETDPLSHVRRSVQELRHCENDFRNSTSLTLEENRSKFYSAIQNASNQITARQIKN